MLQCHVLGVGAWGPGFHNWPALRKLFRGHPGDSEDQSKGPKPEIIPANERRRAPLSVRLAVETSSQACDQAGIDPSDIGCVFASGLGDTDITDYMCRILTTEQKQISPTKFHNSVHNAAAGYWTISTACMQAANSVAGFDLSASLNLLEGISQCHLEKRPILLTFFDAPVSSTLRPMLKNEYAFGASIVIAAGSHDTSPCLTLNVEPHATQWQALQNETLNAIYDHNPCARILLLLEQLVASSSTPSQSMVNFPLSSGTSLTVEINR